MSQIFLSQLHNYNPNCLTAEGGLLGSKSHYRLTKVVAIMKDLYPSLLFSEYGVERLVKMIPRLEEMGSGHVDNLGLQDQT